MSDSFRLYGIFGFPLGHTLSPGMQEAAFRALGLKAFYLPFEVRPKDFRRLMSRASHLLLDGFNVTVPYKEEILSYLDGLGPSARAIGAVNTVVRKGKRWMGFNTDETGFITSLEREGRFKSRGKRVLILGAGGSARAVAYALARGGARSIAILNRTETRARKMIREFRCLFPRVEWLWMGDGSGGDRFTFIKPVPSRTVPIVPIVPIFPDLVVNATSVGLKTGDPALVSPTDFPKETFFVDLIYNPSETRLLSLARESGHRTLNGLGMLVHQGAEAFRLWTGRSAPLEVMHKALAEGLRHAH